MCGEQMEDSQDLASGEKLEHEKMVTWARTDMKIERNGQTVQTVKKHLQASVIGWPGNEQMEKLKMNAHGSNLGN